MVIRADQRNQPPAVFPEVDADQPRESCCRKFTRILGNVTKVATVVGLAALAIGGITHQTREDRDNSTRWEKNQGSCYWGKPERPIDTWARLNGQSPDFQFQDAPRKFQFV